MSTLPTATAAGTWQAGQPQPSRPVAVLGVPTEPPCALLIEALQQQGTPVLVLDQRRSAELPLHWQVDDDGLQGQVQVDGRWHGLHTLAGLYLRPMDDRLLWPAPAHPPQRLAAAQAWTQAWVDLAELLDALGCRVTNPASAMASNASKPYQSQRLREAGLALPAMLVGNEPEAVRRFHAEQGALIYKSASGVRSIVRALDDAGLARLDAVRHAPVLFQQQLRGTNVRVHVVGRQLLATEIDSDGLDYRYAGRDGGSTTLRATTLDAHTAGCCLRAAQLLALPLAGLDLMLCDDGRTVCFEANPSPGYSWYETSTGQPIAATLARYLAGLDD